MKLRFLLVLALAGAPWALPLVRAAERLRLEDTVSATLASNSSLAAEVAEAGAVPACAQREELPTPHVVGGDAENVGDSGSLSSVCASETTLRLGRVIEPGGKRAGLYLRQAEGTAHTSGHVSAI